ncbi:putative u1 zinc finger domain-containing protein [Botrytis fragariae]|uniref:Putative u1 zinc finger domain-containing protein n=1 Tax=Botrytis fragariae TaxID=1964551 RepID=A0A8H6B2T9_9HELO|nr:putative u1 zinc finger domain-containing protein [Botrytis fragariae]KAF5878090.1 putative u1 zinc finger domain-containing protein [Botrytis fragariae]
MSEYWKSTPSYWCKHCKQYVKDTKLEKANHEASPRHQGNLKRFLRDLHRGHEKDEREKDRAKNEIARLNGIVSGSGDAGSSSQASRPSSSTPKPPATAAQRKQQLAQLAELGVSVPDEFRSDMAMAGEWQVTSERVIDDGSGETKADALALGVRKREAEDEDEEAKEAKKRRWGTAIRTYPTENNDDDLDALLSHSNKGKGPDVRSDTNDGINIKIEKKLEEDVEPLANSKKEEPVVKPEAEEDVQIDIKQIPEATEQNSEPAASGVVFKKRKAKNIRQR